MMLAMGLPYVGLALAGAAIILVLARTQARATVYTITTARVAMRIGAALTITLNLPFSQVASASADLRKGGTGTIAMQIRGSTRISYLVCWPHVRPWTLRRAEPALRCIPDAAAVARILSEAAEARVSLPVVSRRLPLAAIAAE